MGDVNGAPERSHSASAMHVTLVPTVAAHHSLTMLLSSHVVFAPCQSTEMLPKVVFGPALHSCSHALVLCFSLAGESGTEHALSSTYDIVF